MNYRNLIDCHTHSNFSPDGENSPEEMCERAIELGLKAYAITDHCECGTWFDEEYYDKLGITKSEDPFVTYNYRDRFFSGMECISKLKEKYHGKLNLICGIELGQSTQGLEGAEVVASNDTLDFIIGSLHMVKGYDDFAFLKYENMDTQTINNLLQLYFNELLEMTRWGKFDVIGHITYPLRYIEGNGGISVDLKQFEEVIREIFRTLAEKGKGIEINTSGLRQKYGKTFPSLDLIKIYRECGGEIITLGSDSHCVSDLGKGIGDGAEISKIAGFKYLAYFKKHNANFISID